MTEKKRFVIKTVEEDCIFDNRDCKYYDELDMTIALLNELSDENGQLKKEIDFISKARLSSNELLQLVYSELLHEGSITFERYTEIRDFCYEQFKKEVSE